jgi:hypothetical protein
MRRTILIGAALALALGGCQSPRRHHHHLRPATVYHLRDGRYAWADQNNVWWYYVVMSQSTSDSGSRLSSTLPSGGTWSRGDPPSASELQQATSSELNIDVGEAGEPLTQAEADVIAQEANDLGPDTGSEAAASSAESPSSDSGGGGDSGGGDSGGGGDGGGGSSD